jgi:adenine deaminase
MALDRFSVPPLATVTRRMVAVAQGRERPQLIIRDARVLSTYSERMLGPSELWIAHGRIAAIKRAGTAPPGFASAEYDAAGGIIAPGLIDAHLHIESSMITACAYAEAALLNGTTTIFCDSHEIGNVLGAEGIEMMLEDARQAPLSIFLTLPSTIPATHSGLETAGAELTPAIAGDLFDRWPEIVALGEKMDFVPVASGDPKSHALIAEALKRGRPVSGHVYGREYVAAYAAAGITDTHEAIDGEIASDLLEAGLWIFLRGGPPGSPWDSLPAAITAITRLGANPKRFCLCTDDRDTADLLLFGMDYVAREAVSAGLSLPAAWSLGSLHAATRYGMDGEIGALGNGRRADLVLLNDNMDVQNTWYGGELMVEDRRITPVLEEALGRRYVYPPRACATVHIGPHPALLPKLPAEATKAHVIQLGESLIVTEMRELEIKPGSTLAGFVTENELVYLAVLERHGKNGGIGHGLLRGFGLRDGAVASSVGHDAHNLIIAGTNERDMQVALDTLIGSQGGICIVRQGEVLSLVELPVAGLIAVDRVHIVAKKVEAFRKQWDAMGCRLPYMGFNLLPLSVIPALRLTDKGLVRVPEMEIVPLFFR